MPCFQCGKQFTVLSRERSCDECKRLFCSRCLRYKHKVSTPTAHTMKLCYACYERINNPNQQRHTGDLDPPKILLDRMMRLEINRTPPHVKPINTANRVTSNSNTSQDDLETRTKNLLYDVPSGSIPSIEELESRLHNLMDVKASEIGSSKVFPELSDEEKVSRIISQVLPIPKRHLFQFLE
ncbi:hypothetical protein FGIG_10525 [Fasciola gigantica]|uniref:FYVE-type domain-containing protein n=1 Tax=Fasciola gigantica TaxID=46835 RepID=A0A504YNJ7_FASGI|nr:hypothetical protein FGIG_10525 [Fasciola gigantica]